MAVLPILMAASAAVSAVGSVVAGNQQAAALNAEAAYKESAAQQAGKEAAANEAAVRNENRRLLGRQIASVGASGLELSGSPLDFTMDSLVDAEMEAISARYQGETMSANLRTQAGMDRMGAKSAKMNGYLGGAAALIGGAADYYRTKKP